MREKLRQWIFVIMMGMVLPSVVLNVVPKQSVQKENSAAENVKQEKMDQMIQLLQTDGTVSAMKLEDYVVGVVLAEMPADFESEALKAQAVLARTYALKRSTDRDKHSDADVCTESSCCQGYCPEAEYKGDPVSMTKVKNAVADTEGQVLVYQGQLIEATYFSCSGGRTEDAQAVWGTDVPYLQATDSPGEEQSDHYTTTVVLKQEQCLTLLGLQEPQLTVGQVSYTDGGGVAEIRLCEQSYTGVQVRQLLSLKSTAFRMNVVGSNVIITVKGYGHRVGMSQYGADAMAVTGCNYEQILTHYYLGTDLTEYPI